MLPFSEAMLLGRLQITPSPGLIFRDENHGCALGMALRAVGIGMSERGRGYFHLLEIWPYLNNVEVPLPCGCLDSISLYRVIVHVFDYHICGEGHGDKWTLEQLADFVRQYEPKVEENLEEKAEEKVEENLKPSLFLQKEVVVD